MKNKKKVSVVIIARNEEENIERCLNSVLKSIENFESKEIIIVDSFSEDRTLEIIKDVIKEKGEASWIKILELKKFYRKEDYYFGNASASRNFGFKNSSGEYVQFLDGDMTLDEKWLTRAVSFLERKENIEKKIVAVSGLITQNKTKDYYLKKFGENLENFTRTKTPREIKTLFGAFIIKAEILREVGLFNPNIKMVEEGELSDRLTSLSYRIFLLPYPMACHFVEEEPQGLMKNLKKRFMFSFSEGQVFRASLFRKKFFYRTKMYISHIISTLFFLLILSLLLFLNFSSFFFFFLFLCIVLNIGVLVLKEKNYKSATFFFLSYLFSWIFFIIGFIFGIKGGEKNER